MFIAKDGVVIRDFGGYDTMQEVVMQTCDYLRSINPKMYRKFVSNREIKKFEEFIGINNTAQTDRTCLTCFKGFNFEDAYYPDENNSVRCLCPNCFTGNHAHTLVDPKNEK